MVLATRSVMPVVGGRTVGPRVGDKVELRGLFMKLVTYAGQGGTQENAPLIITSHPVFYRPPRASGSGGSALEGLIFLAVVLFVIYFALMFLLRRRQEGKNRQIEARRKARELLGRPSAHEEVDEPSKPAEPAQGGDEFKEP
jgi:hypothetical protein